MYYLFAKIAHVKTQNETNDTYNATFDMSKGLFTYLLNRVPTKLAMICSGIEKQNGFEAYRQTNLEEDPILENAELQLTLDMNKLATIRCKDITETKKLVAIIESKRQ